MRLVLATANPDKAREILDILTLYGFEIVPRPSDIPDVEETGASLEENARLKAWAIAKATGEPAVADDTGLEVEALGGEPGVLTARYAGPEASYADNVAKLLHVMSGIGNRRARFRTVAVAAFPDGSEHVAEGIVGGVIAGVPRGTEGFGYDPVFVPDHGDGRTFAELTLAEKRTRSHRGKALTALAEMLRSAE